MPKKLIGAKPICQIKSQLLHFNVSATPEPEEWLLICVGLLFVVFTLYKQRIR